MRVTVTGQDQIRSDQIRPEEQVSSCSARRRVSAAARAAYVRVPSGWSAAVLLTSSRCRVGSEHTTCRTQTRTGRSTQTPIEQSTHTTPCTLHFTLNASQSSFVVKCYLNALTETIFSQVIILQ